MKTIKHKLPKPLLAGIVSLTMLTSSASAVDPVLTNTQLHAVLGVVTNFILDDGGITHNGTSYSRVTSPYTGRVWLDRNLGASQVCTSSTDTACYGDYYQWGRNHDGHQESNSLPTATQATDVNSVGHGDFIQGNPDWASVDGAGTARMANWSATDGSSICPVGFRVPTLTELQAETLDNGVTNSATAFSNFLKLPVAGFRNYTLGSLFFPGVHGSVWAISVNGSLSYGIYFDSVAVSMGNYNRAHGFTVRCIEKISPHEVIHNGIAYDTVTSPYTGKVWLDRNLGASQVCTSSTDTACYGDYYQWGRGYDGHQESTSATTTTQATDINSVGHGDFIQGSVDWASVDGAGTARTANWSATDGSSVCPVGFRVPTLTELQAETLDNGVTNTATAFSNFLKLPTAGYRSDYLGALYAQGSWGNVWASSVNGSISQSVNFGSSSAYAGSGFRASGFSVRCLRD